jgi:hypothetical protein
MRQLFFSGIALLLILSSPALARGVCSTGEYKSCSACCKSNPKVLDTGSCVQQCGDYLHRSNFSPANKRSG